MESDPGARDVFHDIVLADGEVVECFGPDTCPQQAGPLTTSFHSGRSRATFRAVPVDGAERAFD